MRISGQQAPSLLLRTLSQMDPSRLQRFNSIAQNEANTNAGVDLSKIAITGAPALPASSSRGLSVGMRVNQPRLFELLQQRLQRQPARAFDLPVDKPADQVDAQSASKSVEPSAQSLADRAGSTASIIEQRTQTAVRDAAAALSTAAQTTPTPAQDAPDIAQEDAAAAAAPRKFTGQDLVGLMDEFGSSNATRSDPLQYDLNGDGRVGPMDLLTMLSNIDATPAQRGGVTKLLSHYGAKTGDARFDATMDLDGDGVIGPGDLLATLAGQQATTPSAQQTATGHDDDGQDDESSAENVGETQTAAASSQPRFTGQDLVGLMDEFGSSNATRSDPLQYDLNGDGRVGPMDLLTMLSNIDATPAQRGGVTKLLSHYGAKTGDARFDATMDLDGDGVIGPGDLLATLAGQQATTPSAQQTATEHDDDGQDDESSAKDVGETQNATAAAPRTFGQTDLEGLLAEFGQSDATRTGSLKYDLNGDGTVGPQDLLSALANFTGEDTGPRAALNAVQRMYGARAGDDRFNSTFDLDNDGVIGPGDLLSALSQMGSIIKSA